MSNPKICAYTITVTDGLHGAYVRTQTLKGRMSAKLACARLGVQG